jgi:hypothetical protein
MEFHGYWRWEIITSVAMLSDVGNICVRVDRKKWPFFVPVSPSLPHGRETDHAVDAQASC